MDEAIALRPIGVVEGGRRDSVDDHWEDVESTIVLDDRFSPQALLGLEQFSHLDVVYLFHLVDPRSIEGGARHPRGNPSWPLVGIFAQRAKGRPNRLGVSTCRIVGIDGRRIAVRDLDAVDGSPVLDLKPHMTGMGPRGAVVEPQWAVELMAHYWR